MPTIADDEEFAVVQEKLASGGLTPEQQKTAQQALDQYQRIMDPGAGQRTPEDDFASIAETGKAVEAKRNERDAMFATTEEFNPEGPLKTTGPSLPNDFDAKLQSASKRKGLYRSPEVIHTDVGSGRLGAVFDSLPSSIGGRVEEYMEPTFDQFKAEMEPHRAELQALGFRNLDNENDVGTQRLYKEYADSKWAEVYDQAQAEKRSVSRVAHRANPEAKVDLSKGLVEGVIEPIGDDARNLYSKGLDALAAGSMGALNHGLAVVPGAGDAIARGVGGKEGLAQLRASEERNPAATAVGSVAGAASPLAAPTRLSLGVTSRLGGIAPGLARGVGAAAVGGGAGAALDAAGNTVAGELAEGGDITTEQFGEKLVDNTTGAATVGALGGIGGELIGRGAKAGLNKLRDPTTQRGQEIRKLEDAGGSLGLGGPKRSPDMEALANKVRNSDEYVTEETLAADSITPKLADAASAQGKARAERMTRERAQWSAQNPDARVDSRPFADRLVKLMKRNMGSDNQGPLPLADNSELLEIFEASMVTKKMPIDEARALQAQGRGFVIQKPPPKGTPPDALMKRPNEVDFAMPREFSADDVDRVAALVDSISGAAKPTSKMDPEGYKQLGQAIREVRDRLPGGYSAMKGKHEELIGEFHQATEHGLGLRKPGLEKVPGYTDMEASGQSALRNKALNYQRGGDTGPADKALRLFAEDPAVRQELAQIPGLDAFKKLKERSQVLNSPHATSKGSLAGSGRLEGIGLRSDPIMQNLASTPVSPKLRQVLNRMRASGGRVPPPSTSGSLGSITAPRGGALGVRAAAGTDTGDALTEEDIQNLGLLITAVEREQQAPPPE